MRRIRLIEFITYFTAIIYSVPGGNTGNPMEVLEDYCNKFLDIMKPYICRAINFPSTTTTIAPNSTTTEEWWEEDCSCELTCATTQNSEESKSEEGDYVCTSCGSECPVNTSMTPQCSCAVLGGSKKSSCSCTATCASFRYELPFFNSGSSDSWGWEDATSSCIFNVNNLNNGILADTTPEHTCECTKSKSAENNTTPNFVCICQPSH